MITSWGDPIDISELYPDINGCATLSFDPSDGEDHTAFSCWTRDLPEIKCDFTIEVKGKKAKKQLKALMKMSRFPKLPRKLKKRVKRDYFAGQKKVNSAALSILYAVIHPEKTKWLGTWKIVQQKARSHK